MELPVVVQPEQARVMVGRFEAGRRLYNAVLGDALKTLDLMRNLKIGNDSKRLLTMHDYALILS